MNYRSQDPFTDVILTYLAFARRGSFAPLPARHCRALQYFDDIIRGGTAPEWPHPTREFYYEETECAHCHAELWLEPSADFWPAGDGVCKCRVCGTEYVVRCSRPESRAVLERSSARRPADEPEPTPF